MLQEDCVFPMQENKDMYFPIGSFPCPKPAIQDN